MPSDYFVTLARYNAWANRRLYRACGRLSESEYLRDRVPAFGSLHATLNHIILVADRVWLARIEGRTPPGLDLEQILYADLIGLKVARMAEARICAISSPVSYKQRPISRWFTAIGEATDSKRLCLVLGHMFNRQAHYRGKASVLPAQTEVSPPSLDLIRFVRQE